MSDPTIAYSFDNLELLCQACHNKEHFGSSQKKRYKINPDGSLSY
jgi:5-methylcytosine-specific restriction endonuclease McrA